MQDDRPDEMAPELEWLKDDVPRATRFADTYFSKAGGLAETRHVFLSGNGLPARWAGRQSFTIAELGFGTGLNFLATLDALGVQPDPPHLTFLSFELYPLARDQLARALSAFPEAYRLAAPLLEAWDPAPGWQMLPFQGADLVLGVGDARQLIGGITPNPDRDRSTLGSDLNSVVVPQIDAWFLDGFSPARNPELWEHALLRAAAGITAPGGTLATYTSAGWVRRNLMAAGFDIAKTSGFAGKREMVTGSLRMDTPGST